MMDGSLVVSRSSTMTPRGDGKSGRSGELGSGPHAAAQHQQIGREPAAVAQDDRRDRVTAIESSLHAVRTSMP